MSKKLICLMLLCFFLIFSIGCAQKIETLVPKEGTHQFPYFKSKTSVWNYNDQIPGPVLTGRQGTTLVVNLHNSLKESTSVHWHGLRIENAMDGVPGVTQAPIQPGETFTYRLKLNEAGTFWYHPHFNAGEQLERGLKGALIVEASNPLPWSQDVVWLLDDWRMQKDGKIYPHFNIHPDLMHDGRWGNMITINGEVQPEILVSPGERIRLRLINGANARIFLHSLQGLSARVIAVDGRPVSSFFKYENFPLSPGNRVDLDITIPKDAAGKTYSLEDDFTRSKIILGKIKVREVPSVSTPEFKPPTLNNFIPAELFLDKEISKNWDLNAVRGGKFGIGWAMNQRLWPEADAAEYGIGVPVKIQFTNLSNRLHPMHIHGAFFRVLSVNGKENVESFTRDTVLVGPMQTIVIGMIPEHRGIWLTHCHIQAHAESGMMTTISVD